MKKETTYIRKAAELWPELKEKLPPKLQDLSLETNYEQWRQADTAIAYYLTPKTGSTCSAANAVFAESLLSVLGPKFDAGARIVYAFRIQGSSYWKGGTWKILASCPYAIGRYLTRTEFPKQPTDFEGTLTTDRMFLECAVPCDPSWGEEPDTIWHSKLSVVARDEGLRHDDTEYHDKQLLETAVEMAEMFTNPKPQEHQNAVGKDSTVRHPVVPVLPSTPKAATIAETTEPASSPTDSTAKDLFKHKLWFVCVCWLH